MKKGLFVMIVSAVIGISTGVCAATMYSREDGAPIQVYTSEIKYYAQNYANPDEQVTLYSRDDGAEIKVWASEVAKCQSNYATGRQKVTMYSKYDGTPVIVWAYEAAGASNAYYGEKTKVNMYSKNDLAKITVWGSQVQSMKNNYFLGSDVTDMYSLVDGAKVSMYVWEALNADGYALPNKVVSMYSRYDMEEIRAYASEISLYTKGYYAPDEPVTGFGDIEVDGYFRYFLCENETDVARLSDYKIDFKIHAEDLCYDEAARYPSKYYGTRAVMIGKVYNLKETDYYIEFYLREYDSYYGRYTCTYVRCYDKNTEPHILEGEYLYVWGIMLGLYEQNVPYMLMSFAE